MKFKVGDKVRILPSAIDVGVWAEEIGKVGVVVSSWADDNSFVVEMLLPCKGGTILRWSVRQENIALVIEIGQQLMFSFMETEE